MVNEPIGFVVAMDAELCHLLDAIDSLETREDGIWTDHHGTIAGLPVVALRSGVGLINAAAATERLINTHAPRLILNYGCAGAHHRDLFPGDIVIGGRVVHHSALMVLPTGEERHKGFGYQVAGESVAATELAADPHLLALAQAAAEDWRPVPWPDDPARTPRIVTGPVASADIWTQSQLRLDTLHNRHRSLCEDMEAAAVAQICALHTLPFLTIKDISNNEYHRASNLDDFSDFPADQVGRRAAGLMVGLLTLIAQEKS